MRSGACTVQQTLTTEAASVLKHSLSLARRRGHAQVTPLHVAATLLMTSKATILRRACIKSQINNSSSSTQNTSITTTQPPLHCRALELCFNVALNRLPTTPGPLLHGQPSLSNALIAALKRAQAHQRRGCIENQQTHHQNQQQCQQQSQQQQPPLLAIKVELEQLILSILDDPSVSRVMREAGFSSTAVKSNLEDFSSSNSLLTSAPRVFFSSSSGGGVYSSPSSPNSDHHHQFYHHHHHHHQNPSFLQTHFLNHSSEQNPVFGSSDHHQSDVSLKKDVRLVVEVLLGKKQRKNAVIVGDSLSLTEGVVIELMGQVERGEVPDELRCAHFIKFQFSSVPLRFMKREEVEMNLADLRRKVESLSSTGGGVIIYAGDLKWTVEHEKQNNNIYSPVDHLVVEIGRLVSQYNTNNNNVSSNKVWLIGTANYQTFMKCKMMKKHSLELQWSLQAVSVPSGGLGLSLNANTAAATTATSCGNESRVNLSNDTRSDEMVDRKPLISSKEEGGEDDDVMVAMNCCAECYSNYEKEAAKPSTVLPFWLHPSTPISSTLHKENLMELRRKWNRLCQSLHQGRHNLNSNYMNSSSLITNDNQRLNEKSYSYNSSRYPFWPNNNNHLKNNSSISFGDSSLKVQNGGGERSYPRFRRQQSCHIDLSFTSGNHDQKVEQEPNLDSLKSREDDKEVKITLGLGDSTSDLGRRQHVYKFLQENVPWHSEKMHMVAEFLMSSSSSKKKDFWFLMDGNDSIGKRRLAMAIAEAMFGSKDSFLCFNMRGFMNKSHNLERELKDKDVVVFVEDADFGDGKFLKSLSDGFEKGKFGEKGHVIFVLSKGDHVEDEKRSSISTTRLKLVVKQMNRATEMDQKRKPKWDTDELSKRKVPRIEEDEIKKDLSRQSSSNTLDLNIKAEADDQHDENEDPLEFSPNSSDLTREMDGSPRNPIGFLETVKTRFVFDRSPARDSLMRDNLMFKMKGAFEEVFGSIEFEFKVEEMVLEEVLFGFGLYLNGLFEKWLKEVFQTSLEMVKNGGTGVKSLRVCLVIDEKEGGGVGIQEKDERFMGSNLPNKIKICFIM